MQPAAPVCLFPGTIGGGGIGRVMLALAGGMAERGHPVHLVLAGPGAQGDRTAIPAGVTLVHLPQRTRAALPALARHLKQTRPGMLLSARDHINLLALAAHRLARLGQSCKLVWSYHTHRASQLPAMTRTERLADRLALRLQHLVDSKVAVSHGIARDLELAAGLAAGAVQVIANPAWSVQRAQDALAPCPHPWLRARSPGQRDPAAPVIVAAGRLVPQKDFTTLLTAFDLLRRDAPHLQARLLVLGDGPDRAKLLAMVTALKLSGVVDLPGHQPDALPWFSRADLFVLSSLWEGQPLALIEAMGCGCPVVATDCPTGPADILSAQAGVLGQLVPTGNPALLADAMRLALTQTVDPVPLRIRAAEFDAAVATDKYLKLAIP